MKRIKYVLVFMLLLLVPVVTKASAKVDVYLFEGEGSRSSENAKSFLGELKADPEYGEYFDIVEYEVWNDEDNYDLLEMVADEFNRSETVPFIVIGNNCFDQYKLSMNEEIKNRIRYEYNNDSYVDVVDRVKNELYTSGKSKISNHNKNKSYGDRIEKMLDRFFKHGEILDSDRALFITFLVLIGFTLLVCLALTIYTIVITWKVFKKAGRGGWEAIIPIYNLWVLYEISGYPGYYALFILIPFFGIFISFAFLILAAISLSKKFKKEGNFHILLWLIPIVGYTILAFGKATYDDSLGEHKNKKNN